MGNGRADAGRQASERHLGQQTGERYVGGYSPQLIREILGKRTAQRETAFFLPLLRPGMSVLDCGCGPGAITVELAGFVAPGSVVGIDIEASQSGVGMARAREWGVDNVRFQQGNLYRLPFADASFDAVLAHAVLYHLRDPERALGEIRRVLKPGGVAGLRDLDDGGTVVTPINPLLERAADIGKKLLRRCGGDPLFGRKQAALMRKLGFTDVTPSASYDCYAGPAVVRSVAAFQSRWFNTPDNAELIVDQGWASREELQQISRTLVEWGEHEDAFVARARLECVGRKS
jgi:SAM-dependent methyltransferase